MGILGGHSPDHTHGLEVSSVLPRSLAPLYSFSSGVFRTQQSVAVIVRCVQRWQGPRDVAGC